jgi:ParB-like chromosome segregation protein Spo0J
MNTKIQNTSIMDFQIHPEVLKTVVKKDIDNIVYTLNKYGQQNPILTVLKEGQLLIIDGVSRYNAAKQLKLTTLDYRVIEVKEDKILEYRLLNNIKTKKSITELCFQAEYILNVLGKSQGKKRELLALDEITEDTNYGKIGKDRFDLACALLNIENMKSSTLRKLMKVFLDEYNPDGKSESGKSRPYFYRQSLPIVM